MVRRSQPQYRIAGAASELKVTRKTVPRWYSRISDRPAILSYTLNVVHLPFLLLLRAAFVRSLDPGLASLPALLIIFGLGLSYAFVVWWATEGRTDQIREAIGRAFGIARSQDQLRVT
jgi:hypothetical protein